MKRFVITVLSVFMLCTVFVSAENVSSGTCGDNLTWIFEGGALTISGQGEMYLALPGSALTGDGVRALLDAVVQFLPEPPHPQGPLCGVVFASEESKSMGRAAYVRLFSGNLKNRDAVLLPRRDNRDPDEKKITQIRRLRPDGRGEDAGELQGGDIACIYGLGEAAPGQPIGDPGLLPEGVGEFFRRDPPLMASVLPGAMEKEMFLKTVLD